MVRLWRIAVVGLIGACAPDVVVEAQSGSTGSPPGPISAPTFGPTDDSGASGSADASPPATETSGPLTDAALGSGSTGSPGEGSTDEGSSSTGPIVPDPIGCAGGFRQCGDGIDNDGDGLYDVYDPECTGACDNDEGSFQMDLPGEDGGCDRECAFDGNSDPHDDRCEAFLPCDPESPGDALGCPYDPPPNCNAVHPQTQSDHCIDACLPLTPPGCDCLGCCVIDLGVAMGVFMDSGDDCRRDNLDACESCSVNWSCYNPCNICEKCFGDLEPPPEQFAGCEATEDCGPGEYCYDGCCLPTPAE